MNVVAIIQARLGSTRLPNKVLLPLAGRSMLENVQDRVGRAKLLSEVIVAWPNGFIENDLLTRYLFHAKKTKADLVIRICADNPVVEPEAIDWLIENAAGMPDPCRILKLNSENFLNDHDGFGGELYTLEMLEWMDRVIKDPVYREHPHKFWQDMGAWIYVGKDYPQGFRLDVNTEAEYQKLKDIYDHFGHNRFTVKEVMDYLNAKNLAERPFLT